MTSDGISLETLFYMLGYAFKALRQHDVVGAHSEKAVDFKTIEDVYGAILARGISKLLKSGLHRNYVEVSEDLPVLRGRIDIAGSIRHIINRRQVISCVHDEFSANNQFNQVLKTAANLLLRSGGLKNSGAELRRQMVFFYDVDSVDPRSIKWSALQYTRGNECYRLLMTICWLVINKKIVDDVADDAKSRINKEYDRCMSQLFENFVREYYISSACGFKVHPGGKKIDWGLDDSDNINGLPEMKSDIMIRGDNHRTLIIDTKYYKDAMQHYRGKETARNAHLYQILSYVGNYKFNNPSAKVDGMLLYAITKKDKWNESERLNWTLCNHNIALDAVNLSLAFSDVRKKLDEIANEYFHKGGPR